MKVFSAVVLCVLVAVANGQSASVQGSASVQAPTTTTRVQGATMIAPIRNGLNTMRVNLANSMTQAREGINNMINQAASMANTGIEQFRQTVPTITAMKQSAVGTVSNAIQNGLTTGAGIAASVPFGAAMSTGMTTAGNLVGTIGQQAQKNLGTIGGMHDQGLLALASSVPGFASAAQQGATQAFDEIQSMGALGFDVADQNLDTAQTGIDTVINAIQGAIPSSVSGSVSGNVRATAA